ncbi:MAG: hypothetical protein Q7S27_03900 [Nanoarchaeota archaeon]|nr:hypothetical protein [Nanoarchaeota archaeon]
MQRKVRIKKETIIPTFIILIIILIFFFPVKMNNLCKPNSPCPISNSVIKITELKNSLIIDINYIYLLIEIIISYILAVIVIYFYNKNK